MNLPEYITVDEVKRVCKELGISDWTQLAEAEVTTEEAAVILESLGVLDLEIDLEDFRLGLEIELEHGLMFANANVTNNHPVLTGKIVLAHFYESLDYYKRLEVAELEGDLFNAAVVGNSEKVLSYLKRLVKARQLLSQHEATKLK